MALLDSVGGGGYGPQPQPPGSYAYGNVYLLCRLNPATNTNNTVNKSMADML